ncbi:SDR family oxidoreductase [Chryseobacterium soli]|uniref:SDR family oxidoreductase n=1 Tax=Chryseobacterium soli TaxID=445961 RepID=UPI00068D77FB|nr:SDR family oxidoreductase [Chryseobacterium soli]
MNYEVITNAEENNNKEERKSAFITGANKGIGFETAKQMAELGYFVYIGSRDNVKGLEAIGKLKSLGYTNVDCIELDVTDINSIQSARQELEVKAKKLDVLINNAGISGGFPQPATKVSYNTLRLVFETNFFGAIQTTQEFMDLLKKADQPRIVNVTTELSSLTNHSDPSWTFAQFKPAAYGPSKTALNAYTVMLAVELKDTNFKVNCVCPGFTATDFNNHQGTRTVEQGASVIVKYATLGKDGATGKFFNEKGETPW